MCIEDVNMFLKKNVWNRSSSTAYCSV